MLLCFWCHQKERNSKLFIKTLFIIVCICGFVGVLAGTSINFINAKDNRECIYSDQRDIVRVCAWTPEVKPMVREALKDGIINRKEARAIIDESNRLILVKSAQ